MGTPGPSSSTRPVGDTAAVRTLAAEYDRLNREYDWLLGTVRECRSVEPPEVVYEDGRCTAGPVVVVD